MNIALWIVQILLALLFLFAGIMKFITPVEEMTQQLALPGWFFYFIGACEILGGLGLTLPWLLRIKTWLTPLAAAGLVIIMVGAVITTVMTMGVAMAILPFIVGLLAAFVGYGRWRLTPPPALFTRSDP